MLRLKGVTQHYSWGDRYALPTMLDITADGRFVADGARFAASRSSRTISFGTGVVLYLRTLRRVRIAVLTSIFTASLRKFRRWGH